MKTIGCENPRFNILLTCPPMLLSVDRYEQQLKDCGMLVHCPEFTAILPEAQLLKMVPEFDGWIIGDDPATKQVFSTASSGNLKAAVKWGVGVDNVSFPGAAAAGIPVANTPGMFSDEVADVAAGYVVCLARRIIEIHNGVKLGQWPKPCGASLRGKRAAVVGFGNIGRETVNRLLAFGMDVDVYDPFVPADAELPERVSLRAWPDRIEEADFLVLACSLTDDNHHLVNDQMLEMCKPGLYIVNVSRGPLIDESSLRRALESGKVAGAALDVAEVEPLPMESPLRKFDRCIFGSHNGSNTQEAVDRTSIKAIDLLHGFLTNETA